MRLLIGSQYYPTLDAASVQIQRSATDPVPTCTVELRDADSSLAPQMMQELIILDDRAIPNPTANLALNPSLNPYTANWVSLSGSGLAVSQKTGGGVTYTFTNCTLGNFAQSNTTQILTNGTVTAGVTYVFSAYVQGGSSPTHIGAALFFAFLDAANNPLGTTFDTIGPIPVSTSLTRYTCTGIAPAGAVSASLSLGFNLSSSTNSGTITFTQIQFEPAWFPTQSYPSPWCGPAQTNCVQLPLGQWIRQQRLFAGFVTHSVAKDYHGNVRTLEVSAVGYAWLLGTIQVNDGFTNQADSAILIALMNAYLLHVPDPSVAGIPMINTSGITTGVTVPSLQSNWDDLRTLADGMAGLSGFYWTVDDYWSAVYAQPGSVSQGIGLICDNSSQPDMVTTFPAYNFSAETDFTQPGSTILVIGSGSNVAKIVDPGQTAQLGQASGYFLPPGTSWMRKVNDSTLGSASTCTQRGLAEMLLYDAPRMIYHVTTNVALTPGESIQLTSATEGLSAATLLVQQTSAKWLGTDETLTDLWEYTSDLGAINRAATSMISRIFRQTQKNSSAPAISSTTLAVFEPIGVVDSVATAAVTTSYVGTIQADGPVAYYRLSQQEGTTTDDWSGNGYTGTTHGSPTLGVATLLTDSADASDLAMSFVTASSQYVSLPTAWVPTGAHAWSIECWFKISSGLANGFYVMAGFGQRTTLESGQLKCQVAAGPTYTCLLSCFNADISAAISANTVYHAVGTYDGTSTRLYLNGSLVAGPTAFAVNIVANFASIGADGTTPTEFFSGTIDEVAFYASALSSTQISAHHTAGI